MEKKFRNLAPEHLLKTSRRWGSTPSRHTPRWPGHGACESD